MTGGGPLEAVLERREHRKVVVFRPLYAVGGQELGYLPGSENENMNPWAQAVVETLKGHPLFGHVTLTRSERSPIAALVTELLEGAEI